MKKLREEKGVALVIALIVSVAIMAMVTGMLYMIGQSTAMSGAGKSYATAEEAADGSVNILKDAVNMTLWGEALPDGTYADSGGNEDKACVSNAILNPGTVCTTTVVLPGAIGSPFTATVTVERLFTISLPGSRLEFARAASGVASSAIFFRITSSVTGPGGSTAENSVLYRFAG
jgi:hypothetical protein